MKGVTHMEYKVYLKKSDQEGDILLFDFGENDKFEVDLNSDDQNAIQNLFYKIIELAFSDSITFSLNSDGHDKDLFYEVADDYITKLNAEIATIRQQIPQEIKWFWSILFCDT